MMTLSKPELGLMTDESLDDSLVADPLRQLPGRRRGVSLRRVCRGHRSMLQPLQLAVHHHAAANALPRRRCLQRAEH